MLSPEASIKWHPFSIRNVLGDQLDERDTEDAGEELIEGEEEEEDLEEGESRTRPCEILKRRRLQYESRRIKALLSEHGGETAYRICHLKRCKLIASADVEGGGGSPGDLERTGIRDASKEPDVEPGDVEGSRMDAGARHLPTAVWNCRRRHRGSGRLGVAPIETTT